MKEWKSRFQKNTLRQGEEYYKRDRVFELEEHEGTYTAAVVERDRYNVRITEYEEKDGYRMTCSCPHAKSGSCCKHMAAVLYAIEEYEEQKKSMREEEQKMSRKKEVPQAMDGYVYFDEAKIRESLHLSPDIEKRGRILAAQKKVTMESIDTGFAEGYKEMLGIIEGKGSEKGREFPIEIVFARNRVVSSDCYNYSCVGSYYRSYMDRERCEHIAALMEILSDYLKQNQLGDATDQGGIQLIFSFQQNQANRTISNVMGDDESITLKPRLVKKDGRLSVSFKIGQKKLLLVKDLFEFDENVRNSAMGSYGSSMQLNHRLENFTEQGRRWIEFIGSLVREEREFDNRLVESGNYMKKTLAKRNEMRLFGWRLDQFYEIASAEPFSYEEKEGEDKKKCELTCREGNPRITMEIHKNQFDKDKTFHGISVECDVPPLFYGVKTAYYIHGNILYRMEEGFLKQIRPLARQSRGRGLAFMIGRNKLSDFYYTVLPQIRNVVDVIEEDGEEIGRYLPPEAEFIFYLDAGENNITCRPRVRYGETEGGLVELEDSENPSFPLARREEHKEREIMFLLRQWFPYINERKQEMHCGKDEECMYRVLSKGVDELLAMGEVQCTKRFSSLKITKKIRMSVGVSVSSGLLDLDIATEDLPVEELLEVLNSYNSRKKYHRLKNGDFLDMEDNSYEMLSEMMASLHLSPKDFIKGNVKVPLYRTLYLDKLLEENENVYSERDRHFKNLVRGFKTVNDSDFQLPSALARVLRNYQKNGYRWLRTLENFQFGGILADDMGLGKTLQVIAVLLSAKQEGRKGVSLVVAPASLVFNWGEEIHKFAPELTFALISGTQEERRRKLENYEEADVLITSYDLLKRDAPFYEGKEFLYQIIDEAQYIKNHQTVAAKAVKVIKSQTRFALTGTPIENRLSELWSIFDYLMPGFLYKYEVFRREIEAPIVKNQDETAMERLKKMTAPFILRRLKADVLKDLPDKIEKTHYVRFEKKQQELYDAQVVHMRQQIAMQDGDEFQKNKLKILAELTRLRQICCDPSLCFENYKGESAKLEACQELIQRASEGGHKILLFSQFVTMLEIIRQKLDESGISYYMITGETSKEKRLKLVKNFNENDTRVFLISLKAGGVGLNLTGADVVIHYDPWWNIAVQNQATDRAHRIGQDKKVTVYQLIAKASVEEKIRQIQESKKDLLEQVVGSGAGQLGTMSKEDFLELLE